MKSTTRKSSPRKNAASRHPDKPNAIFLAARKGDLAQVRASLREGTPVDARLPPRFTKRDEPTRQTALMIAAEKGHFAIVGALLKAGADPNAQDEFLRTPLALAVMQNRTRVVVLLLKAGADPNQRWYGGDFALWMAATGETDLKITRLLLAHGADVNAHNRGGTALHIAAFHGRIDIAKVLLKAGADANGPRNLVGGPLSCALAHGQSKMVEFLLTQTVEPKRQPEALSIAAGEGKFKIVKKLLELGFDPNTRACQGRTPLQHARNAKHRSVVDLLVEWGGR